MVTWPHRLCVHFLIWWPCHNQTVPCYKGLDYQSVQWYNMFNAACIRGTPRLLVHVLWLMTAEGKAPWSAAVKRFENWNMGCFSRGKGLPKNYSMQYHAYPLTLNVVESVVKSLKCKKKKKKTSNKHNLELTSSCLPNSTVCFFFCVSTQQIYTHWHTETTAVDDEGPAGLRDPPAGVSDLWQDYVFV